MSRKHKSNYGQNAGRFDAFPGNGVIVHADTINVQYNEYNIVHQQAHFHKKHHRPKQIQREERAPKLFRYCASGGLLDRDVVSKMSSGRIVGESARVISYSGGKALGHLGGAIDELADTAGTVFRTAGKCISWLFDD